MNQKGNAGINPTGGCGQPITGGTNLTNLINTVDGDLNTAYTRKEIIVGFLQDVVENGTEAVVDGLTEDPSTGDFDGEVWEVVFALQNSQSQEQFTNAENALNSQLQTAYGGLPSSTTYQVCPTDSLFGTTVGFSFLVGPWSASSTPIPSGSIQVSIQNSLGTAISGASVAVMGPNYVISNTDANGNVTFSSLPAGTYSVQAFDTGYVPSTTSATITTGTVSFVMTLPSTAAATSVQFSSGPPYTITVNGKGFGSPPQSMPYSGDLGNFTIVDDSCSNTTPGGCEEGYSGDGDILNYQSWTNSQIVVGGYSQHSGYSVASPGDVVEIGIWNSTSESARAGYAWAGNLPPVASNTPIISSVKFSGTGANLQITILGSGFGSTPPSGVPSSKSDAPYTGLTNNLEVSDFAGRIPQTTNSVSFRAGHTDPANGAQDPVTLKYLYWSDSEIDLGGFAGQYGTSPYTIESGDPVTILIWNTTNNLATGWGGYVP